MNTRNTPLEGSARVGHHKKLSHASAQRAIAVRTRPAAPRTPRGPVRAAGAQSTEREGAGGGAHAGRRAGSQDPTRTAQWGAGPCAVRGPARVVMFPFQGTLSYEFQRNPITHTFS